MKQFIDNFAIAREIPFLQVASYYGLQIQNNNMCSCPFHADKHPSMRIYPDHGYCFSCNTRVDNISLVQKLYDCNAVEALEKIKADFGLSNNNQSQNRVMSEQRKEYFRKQQHEKNRDTATREIIKFYRLLQSWKEQQSPKNTGGIPNKYFMYAINNEAYTGYILDNLLAPKTEKEEEQIVSQIITSKWFEQIKKINEKF